MYPHKLHTIKALASLNRKMLEEEFLFWLDQINHIKDYNVALKTIVRADCQIDVSQEMWWNRDMIFERNDHSLIRNERLEDAATFVNSAPGGDFVLDWKINIKNVGTTNRRIFVVPYAGGQLLYEAADIIEHEWSTAIDPRRDGLDRNNIPSSADDGAHSLSGQCNFSSITGIFEVGLICEGVWDGSQMRFANYEVFNAHMIIRRRK